MKTIVNRKQQTTNVPHRIMQGVLVAATLLCLSPHVCAAATGGPALPADAIQSYVPSAIRRGAPFCPENACPRTPSEAIEEALRSGDPDKLYRAALHWKKGGFRAVATYFSGIPPRIALRGQSRDCVGAAKVAGFAA